MKISKYIFYPVLLLIILFSALYFFSIELYADMSSYSNYSSKQTINESVYSYKTPPVRLIQEDDEAIKIYIFYSRDCDSCKQILSTLAEIQSENLIVDLVLYELSENNNASLMFYLLDKMYIKEFTYTIPIIFLGKEIFVGEKEFKDFFKVRLDEALRNRTSFKDTTGEIIQMYYSGESSKNSFELRNYISIPVIIVSALLDSINPCAIGVIIMLITSIIAQKNRKYAMISGLVYIAVIFIVYFLLGIGFIYFIRRLDVPKIIFIIIGSILIISGFFSAKEFFLPGKIFSLGIPGPIKNIIERNIYKTTITSILTIGVLISIFEATCSGAVYLGILSVLSNSGLSIYPLLMLLLYNIIFILPLLIILLIFYFGIPAKKVQRLFIQKNRKIYRLVLGIILILLGLYIIIFY